MENQQIHDAQLAIDKQEEQAAKVEWLASHFAAYAENYDYDSIDEYVVDAEIGGIFNSDVHNWIIENDEFRAESDEFLAGINIESHAQTLMTGYVEFITDPFYGIGG